MTVSVDMSRIRAELEPLVDAYLAKHPEALRRYSQVADQVPAAPPTPPPVPPRRHRQAEPTSPADAAADHVADLADLLPAAGAEDEQIIASLTTAVLRDANADMSVIAEAESGPGGEETHGIDLAAVDAYLSGDDEPTPEARSTLSTSAIILEISH